MNRANSTSPSDDHAQQDNKAPLLWIVRSRRAQKSLIARALEIVEGFETPQPAATLASAIGTLELESLALELPDVCAVLKVVRQFVLTSDAHARLLGRKPPPPIRVPADVTQPMSTLLLRVYLTGSDAGGTPECEQIQRILENHLKHALPATGFLLAHPN